MVKCDANGKKTRNEQVPAVASKKSCEHSPSNVGFL